MRHQSLPTRSRPQPRRLLVASVVAATLSLICAQAFAETAPLPPAAPKESGGPAKPQIGDITGTMARAPTPILPNPALRNVADNGVLDANQRAQVVKISSYLSGLSTLVGNFVQVAPNGKRDTGEFYMQKPGKVRFAYDEPSPLDLVADGKSVVVRDRKLGTQDVFLLSQTPLRYLLSDRIDLLKDTNVVGVSSDDMFTMITIEEKQALIGTSRLVLMVGTKDNQLKQWTITDPQGYDTTIAVYNLNTQKKPDPDLFRIEYQKYDDGRGG